MPQGPGKSRNTYAWYLQWRYVALSFTCMKDIICVPILNAHIFPSLEPSNDSIGHR